MAETRGPYRKTAQRREQILDAADQVFAQQGYTASSLTDVAKTVGISSTGVLHHFGGGKPELLLAVLERRDVRAIENIEGRRGRDFLRGLVDISRMQAGQRGLLQLHTVLAAEATAPTHPGRVPFAVRFGNIAETIARAFDEVPADEGLVASTSSRRAVLSTLAMTEGLGRLWLHGLDIHPDDDLRAHIDSFLLSPL